MSVLHKLIEVVTDAVKLGDKRRVYYGFGFDHKALHVGQNKLTGECVNCCSGTGGFGGEVGEFFFCQPEANDAGFRGSLFGTGHVFIFQYVFGDAPNRAGIKKALKKRLWVGG